MVRGVSIEDMEFGNTTITVSGRVALKGPAAVNPGTDVLELRINKETDWDLTGGSDLREDIGENVDPDGTWEHVLTVWSDAAEAANPANRETFLEWSDGTAVTPSEMTIAEFGDLEPIAGCPRAATDPTAPLMLRTDDSGKVGDHVTNKATDLTFSGLAGTDRGRIRARATELRSSSTVWPGPR